MRRRALEGALCLLAAFVAAGCGGSSDEAQDDATLAVYVSVPLSGADARDGLAVVDGARAALDEAGGEAAGIEVKLVVADSGPGVSGAGEGSKATLAAANARQATEHSNAIAYIGEVDSAATRASLPVTNQAGLLQISPSAGARDLVASFEGSEEVPAETQPSGERTFGTLADLKGAPEELGGEAMRLVLASVDAADDPLDRASVVDAFFALGTVDSPLGSYEIDALGQAQLSAAGS
jgi:Periplasmic binding protein